MRLCILSIPRGRSGGLEQWERPIVNNAKCIQVTTICCQLSRLTVCFLLQGSMRRKHPRGGYANNSAILQLVLLLQGLMAYPGPGARSACTHVEWLILGSHKQ